MEGVEVHLNAFITSVVDGSEWSASLSSRFISLRKSPQCSLDNRLGGPQSRSGSCGVQNNLFLLPIAMGPRTNLGDVQKGKFLTLPGLEL
jgi:hypothetical protein